MSDTNLLLATGPLWSGPTQIGLPSARLAEPVVRFDGITWQSTDDNGVDWICEDLEGWADLPDSDAPATRRTFDHGAWSGPGWFGPRHLILTGALIAPDRAALQMALHRLRGVYAAALADAAVLGVDELDGEKRLGVRAANARLTVQYVTPTAARVVMELVAPWPVKRSPDRLATTAGHERGEGRHYPRPSADDGFRRYGVAGRTGDLHLNLAGNAPIRPRFLIDGPADTPAIIAADQSRALTFLIRLASGDRLYIDADTHAVLLNDVANRRLVLSPTSAWFDLLPGLNHIQYRPLDANGSLTVLYGDGWW